MKLNNCSGNGGHTRKSSDVKCLVNGVTETETACAGLGVSEDFCA